MTTDDKQFLGCMIAVFIGLLVYFGLIALGGWIYRLTGNTGINDNIGVLLTIGIVPWLFLSGFFYARLILKWKFW